MVRREIYEHGVKILADAGIDEASLDAWILFEEVTKVTRADYYARSNAKVAEEEVEAYLSWISERAKRIPLQHILGYQEFMGLKFLVTPEVLIPRQDTEVLVEYVETIVRGNDKPMNILDMCTGSGCIILSLLKRNKEVRGIGVDISPAAIGIAKKNAQNLGVKVVFLQSDLFDKVTDAYDVIVSNPPYIKENDIKSLDVEVRQFDPVLALNGGADGLIFYRRIARESREYLRQGGQLALEIGYDQAKAVSGFMKDYGFEDIGVLKDLAGLDRIVYGVYNK